MNTQPLNKKARRLDVLGALLGLGIFASSASADILLAKQNTNLQSFRVAADLDLDGTVAGNQSGVNFTADQGTLVRVIFNAVGSIAGGSVNWLDSTIFIKFGTKLTACTPSNGDNAFVSGAGAATQNDGLVSAVTQCFYKIPVQGQYKVMVKMTPHPAALWRIDDLSIVIDSSDPQ